MDLRRLKTFVAVAEHGTVSKASEVLRITQPALSRQIGSLEDHAGFKLFERAGRRLRLTPSGEQFLVECRSLLSHAGAVDKRALELRRGELQVLRIVAPALTIEALFPKFLHRYAACVSGIRVVLIDAEAAEHSALLERGEADLSINVTNMLPLDDRRFTSYLLPHFQMLAACRSSLVIGPSDAIDISELAEHPLLLLDRSYATRNVFDAACHLADVRPNIYLESRSVNALLAMAAAGHGVAIIPSVLQTDPSKVRTRIVTHRQEPLELALAVIWDQRRAPLRHAQQFSSLLAEYIRETYPPASVAASSERAARRRPRPRRIGSG